MDANIHNELIRSLEALQLTIAGMRREINKPSTNAQVTQYFIASVPEALSKYLNTQLQVHQVHFTLVGELQDHLKITYIALGIEDEQVAYVSIDDLVKHME